MRVFERSGEYGRRQWRTLEVVSDNAVVIIDMEQALFGWNFGHTEVQGDKEWCGMDRDAIVEWKRSARTLGKEVSIDSMTWDKAVDVASKAMKGVYVQ